MRNFFTEPDLWTGGKAVPLEELAVAFEKAMMKVNGVKAASAKLYGVTATGNRWARGSVMTASSTTSAPSTLRRRRRSALAYGREARQYGPIAWQRGLDWGHRGRGGSTPSSRKSTTAQDPDKAKGELG
jgi:hypothetical protein